MDAFNFEPKKDDGLEAMRRALKKTAREMNKVSVEEEVKVVRKKKPKPKIEQEKGYDPEPLQPEQPKDLVEDGVFEFFEFNPWTGEGEKKQKLREIAEYLRGNTRLKSRGKTITYLSRMNYKMGYGTPGMSMVDKFYKYIRIKMSAKDLLDEAKAYE